ncbi:hypothetical protein D3C85_1653640 [compost metagenome]
MRLLTLPKNTCITSLHLVVILIDGFNYLALQQHRFGSGRGDDGCKIVDAEVYR